VAPEPETAADEAVETGAVAVVVLVVAALLFPRAEDVEEAITWWLFGACGSLFSGLALSFRSVGHGHLSGHCRGGSPGELSAINSSAQRPDIID